MRSLEARFLNGAAGVYGIRGLKRDVITSFELERRMNSLPWNKIRENFPQMVARSCQNIGMGHGAGLRTIVDTNPLQECYWRIPQSSEGFLIHEQY